MENVKNLDCLHNQDVVIFKSGDLLKSLVSGQDWEKVKSHNKKTAKIHSKDTQYEVGNYYTIKFPGGFIIKSIFVNHLIPIKPRKYGSNKRG